MDSTRSIASWGSVIPPSLPGIMGTPAFFMISRAAILDPILSMDLLVGPMKTIPFSSQARAKVGFSERNP